ncbi:MAG: endonuclease [Staphylothermus sp.]|nr:endonuclease [Staphylothermus sp.]
MSNPIVVFDNNTCKGYVTESEFIKELDKRWFGRSEDSKLVLDVVEIAYLILKNRIALKVNDKIIGSFNEFIDACYNCLKGFFWPNLIVYKDLRDRGRRVRVISDNKFLIRDKHGNLRIVIVLEEGSLKKASSIYNDILTANNNGLELVYAIVSLQGDLTYYEVSRIEPRRD